MGDTIFVSHATLGQASSRLAGLGEGLSDDAGVLKRADASLSANWQGSGSAEFVAAAATVEALVAGAAAVMGSESASLSKADEGFSDQDHAAASGIGSAGQ